MRNDEFSQLTNDRLYGSRWNLLEDDLGQALDNIFEAGVGDDYTKGILHRRVHKHKVRQAFSGVPFRQAKLRDGELIFGLSLDGKPLKIPIQFLNAHTLMIGNSGAGKTYRIKFHFLQIASHVSGTWLIDLHKREFRQLRPALARLGINLIILPVRSMKINPLQVPSSVKPGDWIPRISDMLIQVLNLPPRASKLLQRTLFRLYRHFGVLEGSGRYPTLFELYEEAKGDTDANPQARMALIDSLAPILCSLAEVLAYRQGWTSSDLSRLHLAIEFAGIGETEKNLVLNALVLSEFTSRVAKGISNPNMDFWICCDEAQRIVSAQGNSPGRNAVGDLISLVRGTGIGLDLSVLSTSAITPQVISNTATKIMGRCGSAGDYAAAGHSMGLSAEQIQWAQLNLKPGMFIGQIGEGNHRYPFVFTIPQMSFPQVSSNQQSLDDLGSLSSLPIVPAGEFQTWSDNACDSAPTSQKSNSAFESDQEYRFCKVIVENPMLASSKYPKLAGISSKTAGPIRHILIAKGFVREHVLDSSGRGPSSLMLEATPEGVKALREHELEMERNRS